MCTAPVPFQNNIPSSHRFENCCFEVTSRLNTNNICGFSGSVVRTTGWISSKNCSTECESRSDVINLRDIKMTIYNCPSGIGEVRKDGSDARQKMFQIIGFCSKLRDWRPHPVWEILDCPLFSKLGKIGYRSLIHF